MEKTLRLNGGRNSLMDILLYKLQRKWAISITKKIGIKASTCMVCSFEEGFGKKLLDTKGKRQGIILGGCPIFLCVSIQIVT